MLPSRNEDKQEHVGDFWCPMQNLPIVRVAHQTRHQRRNQWHGTLMLCRDSRGFLSGRWPGDMVFFFLVRPTNGMILAKTVSDGDNARY